MPKKAVTSESRRCLINVRTTEAMRKRLEDAAAATGRPLIHEIEHRLETAFWHEERETLEGRTFISPDNLELGEALKFCTSLASRFAGDSWKNSPLARDLIRRSINNVLDTMFDSISEDQGNISAAAESLPDLERHAAFIASLACPPSEGEPSQKLAALWRGSVGPGIGDALFSGPEDN
jgi:hypothetical protein